MSNNDVFTVVKTMVTELVEKANVIAEEVQKSRVNVNKFVHEIRKSDETTDEKVKAYQTKMNKAEAQIEAWTKEIDEYIKTNLVKASEMSDEVFEAKKLEYSEFKKSANAAQKLAAAIPGYQADTFADVPALMTLSGGTAGAATGTRRVRLADLSINGEPCFIVKKEDDGSESKSYTFTNAAAVIGKATKSKVSPSDLSNAAFEAAKTEDLSTVTSVEFSYSVNGTDFAIVAIPAKSAK